ncbi:hypothetical protein TanjilG_04497 [Lupinus angustifolius]|uniref:Protein DETOXIFICATION n=1 Tax=Lupinus angustifolius TaxID=3871 RepID=A0A4P1RQ97_LUPAN|nr:PREDICTED: protein DETOXIFICATION 51-like [Lupinus angustifolius]OIW15962.1 hypothetical protein TanjilG_04497 [Lupinus angustifolius]
MIESKSSTTNTTNASSTTIMMGTKTDELLSSPYTFIDPEKQTQTKKLVTLSNIITEAKSLLSLAFPIALTALIFYTRSIVSMLFLGHLGELELAAGSLAIAFANITGYSILSGLSLGMEPLCSQAFGAKRPKLLSLTLQRCIIFLLTCCIPITLLYINMSKILLLLHQPHQISTLAQTYLYFLLPDLVTNSFLQPIRVYLRAQNVTHPVTLSSLAGTVIHLPFNFLLMKHGVAGVAAASAASNFSILVMVVAYLWISGIHGATWQNPSRECFSGWKPLIRFSAPSCVSVCLEWWWYEIMIVMCGILVDPTATVAAMGVLIQTTSLIYVFPSSLGFAVSTRVGNELGANRPSRARLSAVVAVFFAGGMGFTAVVFALTMRNRWGRMFTGDKEILQLTAAALPILGLCELGNCPQTVGCGVVRGTAQPNVAANVNMAAFYFVGMPVAVGLGFWLDIGFRGLWMGLLSAQVCCAGLMLYVVGTTDWEYQARRAQLLTSVDDVSDG